MSFEEFYNSTYKYIYIFFYNRIGDKSSIDDLCQEVYIRFYKRFLKERELYAEEDIKILFGFCKNIYHERVRELTKNKDVEFFEDYDYSEFLGESFEDDSEKDEYYRNRRKKLKIIARAMQKLRSKTRFVIEYRFFYEMSRKEVASMLNMKERDVLKYQQRGVKYLKEMVEKRK